MTVTRWECEHPGCDAVVCGIGKPNGARALGWQVARTTVGQAERLRCPDHRSDYEDPAQIEAEVAGLQGVLGFAGFVGSIAAQVSGPPVGPEVDLRPEVRPGVVRGAHAAPPPPGPGRRGDTSRSRPVQQASDPELVEPSDLPGSGPPWGTR